MIADDPKSWGKKGQTPDHAVDQCLRLAQHLYGEWAKRRVNMAQWHDLILETRIAWIDTAFDAYACGARAP